MAKPRKLALETLTARARLAARKQPYFVRVAPHIALGYRRNESGFGTWSVRFADGSASGWLKKFGIADDLEPADNTSVYSYDQALAQSRKLARGEADTETTATGFAPISVDAALKNYRADLIARQSNPYNAEHPRLHLTSALLSKPVALLTSKELTAWRDGLIGTMKPSTINRMCRCINAALALAAQHDQRIKPDAWEIGLAGLPDATEVRNVILGDDQVRAFVAEAYGLDNKFGLLIDLLAVTGARPSQAVRLSVEDLHHHPARPRLMMPKSAKGGGRNRAQKRIERYPVPITLDLAGKLRAAAKGRADAPLLLQSDGSRWHQHPGQSCHRQVDRIVKALGLDPSEVTMYALRHGSIVRMLLKNIPIRLVASLHNTSVAMIEKHYSKFIAEHGDDLSRAALLHHHDSRTDNVVALAR
ncbi:site-specific integrase [Bradyrhizobium sp. MOS002]|uniref:site-specific integrase n=1 Tax=Bradyrhizobium sp. MOS002 TaxID=2133947 RepID=UPI000D121408|nr:site-specific integrase [Bradyrhizobium sp. MOS002]PSO30124.1 site-specific integrase [Bradyrhizobium sp. MOS002]